MLSAGSRGGTVLGISSAEPPLHTPYILDLSLIVGIFFLLVPNVKFHINMKLKEFAKVKTPAR